MVKFTGSAAGLQAWVQLCGVEGDWESEHQFRSAEGAQLVWSSTTGDLRYEGEEKAVRRLKAALSGNKGQHSKGLAIFLWVTVSVGFALLPLMANYINGRSGGKPPGLIDLLASGELFLIASALTADGIGRAFLGGERKRGFRIGCGIGCAFLLAANTLYFGRIASSIEEQRAALVSAIQARDLKQAQEELSHPKVDRKVIGSDSLWLFGFSVAAAFGIILVEEE